MPARAALVILVLAGPGLAAPPVSSLTPESDTAAILAAIDAADPTLSQTPAPVEQVVAAAELAEKRLAAADDEDVAELLMLAGAARRIAAQRAPDDAPTHLCAMLADAEQVAGRPAVAESARELKAEALGGLNGAACPAATVELQPKAQPLPIQPEGPPPAPAAEVPIRRSSVQLAVGGTLAGLAAVGVAGMAACLAGRRNAAEEVSAINAAYMTANRAPTADELAAGVTANDRYRRLGGAALGLGLAAGASLAAGLAVMLARPRAPSLARLRAGGAGIVYRF